MVLAGSVPEGGSVDDYAVFRSLRCTFSEEGADYVTTLLYRSEVRGEARRVTTVFRPILRVVAGSDTPV